MACNRDIFTFLPFTYWTGDWVGPRAGLDAVENGKILHSNESNVGRPARNPSLHPTELSRLPFICCIAPKGNDICDSETFNKHKSSAKRNLISGTIQVFILQTFMSIFRFTQYYSHFFTTCFGPY
jgi:hypothetical protein